MRNCFQNVFFDNVKLIFLFWLIWLNFLFNFYIESIKWTCWNEFCSKERHAIGSGWCEQTIKTIKWTPGQRWQCSQGNNLFYISHFILKIRVNLIIYFDSFNRLWNRIITIQKRKWRRDLWKASLTVNLFVIGFLSFVFD